MPAAVQIDLLLQARTLAERATRWLLRNRSQPLDIASTIAFFAPGVPQLVELLPELLAGSAEDELAAAAERHAAAGVPAPLAREVAALSASLPALDISEVAAATTHAFPDTAAVYFDLGAQLRLDWLREGILELPRNDRRQALARGALRDQLHAVHSSLAGEVLRWVGPGMASRHEVQRWLRCTSRATGRHLRVLDEIAGGGHADLAALTVALREVADLALG